MALKVGINGFGRIGRNVVRAAKQQGIRDIDFVAVNDLTDTATLAHLLKYDSVHGRFTGTVEAAGDALLVDGDRMRVLSEKDPAKLPWKELGVDIVLESTGRFNDRDQAAKHHVISNASCTTNCLVPVVHVVRNEFGFVNGFMTTVHSYTNDQQILDLPHKDLRRARAAAVSIIPTSTGAAKATSLVIPELKGKLDGVSLRVPTPDVSVVMLSATVERKVTAEEVNAAFITAANGALKGVLAVSNEPLVSVDYIGNLSSSTIDLLSTNVVDGTLVNITSWYDNEMGYSARCVDLLRYLGSK